MEIIVTTHAKERMLERAVPLKDVESTIENPEVLKSLGENKYKAVKIINRKRVKVIYVVEDNKIIVLTVA